MAFYRWQKNIVDEAGNVLDGASVEIRDEATGLLVNLFEDIDGITSKGNPLTTDSAGYAFAYLEPKRLKITATKGAFSFSLRDVLLPEGPLGSDEAGEGASLVSMEGGPSVQQAVTDRLQVYSTASAVKSEGLSVGDSFKLKGLVAEGDGGGEVYYVQSTAPVAADDFQVIALNNGNFAVRDKPLYVAEAPATAGFAPNEFKYLFMDPSEYAAANSGEAIDVANQFHFFATGPDIRCEFEAGTGSMALYLEAGIGESAFYGWQESGTHLWSFGTDPTSNFDLKLCDGFGVEGKSAFLLVRGPTSVAEGQVQVSQYVDQVAPLVVTSPSSPNALGMLVKAGTSGSTYLADFRLADNTQQVRITGDGHVITQLGTSSSAAFGFIGDEDTGLFNPGANALAITTAGTERARVNSEGNLLIGTTGSGGGTKNIAMSNGTAPTTNIAGGTIYVESGALKYRGSAGTITTLGAA